MKARMSLVWIVVFGLAFGIAGNASAEPTEDAGAKQLSISLVMGEDGKLTREQFFAQNPTEDPKVRQVLETVFDRFDPNHTGVITMSQLAKLQVVEAPEDVPTKPVGPDDEPEDEPAWPFLPEPAKMDAKPVEYAVVISATAAAIPEWKAVADALVAKHRGVLVVYNGSVYNALPDLIRLQPRYTAFVARTEILGRIFVARVHRLTRQLDDDPYTDTIWGIVSGDTPQTALRVAKADQPQIVRSVISLTGVASPLYDEVYTISDGKSGDWYRKHKDGKEERGSDGDVDRVQDFVKQYSGMNPDALVGSGHATERNLEIPFGKGNLEIRDGKWVGVENWRRPGAQERIMPIPENDHPRIFIGAGNCLIGNFQKRKDSLAAVMIGRHGVNQFVGYTMVTWYGKGGWGTLGAWQDFCGTYSLAEAFFFNNQSISHDLKSRFPTTLGKTVRLSERGHGTEALERMNLTDKDEAGMLWDRDVVAFYGDPALRVTLDPAKNSAGTKFSFKKEGKRYLFEATTNEEVKGMVAMMFPDRIKGEIEITAGKEFAPVITDDFILIPAATLKPGTPLRVEFTALPVKKVAADKLETYVAALKSERREAGEFLLKYMPAADKAMFPLELFQENLEQAFVVREQYPWTKALPKDLFFNDVLPYAVVDETRDPWRKRLRELFAPKLNGVTNWREAADVVGANIEALTGAKYNTKREKACQSPAETMRQGMASCTGLSILTVDALRAVGIPARLVAIPMWATLEGNHTWVEIYDGKDWLKTGFADKSENWNKGWEIDKCANCDIRQPLHCVFASSYRTTGIGFPTSWNWRRELNTEIFSMERNADGSLAKLEWNLQSIKVPGIDRTASYIALAGGYKQPIPPGSACVAVRAFEEGTQHRVAVPVKITCGTELLREAHTASEAQDLNDYIRVICPTGAVQIAYSPKAGKWETITVDAIANKETPVEINVPRATPAGQ